MNPLNLVRPFGVVLAGVSMQGRQDRAEAGRSEAGPGDTQDTQHAYSKAGRDLGQVIDSDATHVKVRRSDGLEVRFPKATITLG